VSWEFCIHVLSLYNLYPRRDVRVEFGFVTGATWLLVCSVWSWRWTSCQCPTHPSPPWCNAGNGTVAGTSNNKICISYMCIYVLKFVIHSLFRWDTWVITCMKEMLSWVTIQLLEVVTFLIWQSLLLWVLQHDHTQEYVLIHVLSPSAHVCKVTVVGLLVSVCC
jgi:hypothetical protein